MRLSALAAAAVLLAAAPLPAAELLHAPSPSDPMRVSVHRLSNGLTVYLSPSHEEPRVHSKIVVRAGGKDDPAESTGIAHYLEHMLFKGTSRLGTLDFERERPHLDRITALYDELWRTTAPAAREAIYKAIDAENVAAAAFASPNEIDRTYSALGFGGVNASTGKDRTLYVSHFPSNRAEAWARVEAERFARPVFRLFQTELEAVYEEKNRSLDNPESLLWEAVDRQLYKKHPYGTQTLLGSVEHLKNPSLQRMYAFFETHYRPSNMAVALAGDFDRDAMLALLEKHLGAWSPRPPPARGTFPLPPPQGAERVEVRHQSEERVVVAWPTVPLSHPDVDALRMLDMLMDNSNSGLINLRLNQAQRVKSAGSFPSNHNDAGSWVMWAVPKQGQALEEAEALLLETLEALRRGEFTDADLRAIITDFEVSEKQRLESNDARAGQMAAAFAEYEDWPRAAARLERLRRVTKADVLRAAERYLGPDRVVVCRRDGKPELPAIVKPGFTKLEIDPKRESKFYREVVDLPAKPLEPRFLREGRDFAVHRRPWGRLVGTRNPMNDLFSLSFIFERGSKQERNLCVALDLLDKSGGGALPADDYKRALYALGTSISFGCGEDRMSVSMSGLEANFDASLRLLRDRFEAPNTATDTLKKLVDVAIGAHQDDKKNPEYVSYALGEFARRGPRSAVLAELTDDELRRLDAAALLRLVRGVFAFERTALCIGVRDPGALAKDLGFGGGPRYARPAPREPRRYLREPSAKTLFVHRDMVQSRVGLFAPDEVYDSKKAVDHYFFNSYMDGGMNGVIFQEIREARALAYTASGGYSGGGRKGDENSLWGSLGCQADKTVEAAGLLSRLLLDPPFAEARFVEVRKSIEEDYRSNVFHFRGIPGAVLGWWDRGLTADPRPEQFRRALRYTLADLRAFAKRLKGRALTLYVLGNRERVDLKGLESLGPVRELKLEEIFPY